MTSQIDTSAVGAPPSVYNSGVRRPFQDERGTPRSLASFAGLLLAIVLLAAGIRFYGLGSDDYWLDELHSLMNSGGRHAASYALPQGEILYDLERPTDLVAGTGVADVWRTTQRDAHPPLYFVLLHGWRRLFGSEPFAVRSLSVIFSVLSLAPVAVMFRLQRQSRTGLLAAFLLAVAFSHVFIGREARPYSLGLLFVCTSFALVPWIEQGWQGWSKQRRAAVLCAYALTVYLAVMSHYFTTLPLAAQAVYVLGGGRGPSRRAWLATLAGAAAFWWLSWGAVFLGQIAFIKNQPWLIERTADHLPNTMLRFFDLPVRLLFQVECFAAYVAQSATGAGLFLVFLLMLRGQRTRAAWMCLLWFVVPVVALTLADLMTQRQTLNHLRYTSIVVPGLIGIAALALDRASWWTRLGVGGVLVLAASLTLRMPIGWNPDVAKAVSLYEEVARPGDLVSFDAIDWPPHWALRLYLLVAHQATRPPVPCVMLREAPTLELRRQMAAFSRIVVITPRSGRTDHAVPPGYRMTARSSYVRGIGTIEAYERNGPAEPSSDQLSR